MCKNLLFFVHFCMNLSKNRPCFSNYFLTFATVYHRKILLMNHLTHSRRWTMMALLWFGMSIFGTVWAQHMMKGKATYYADFFHGKRCADGSIFNQNGFTCAHRTLPFGTVLKVTNQRNGLSTIVTVTDRGPYGIRYHL